GQGVKVIAYEKPDDPHGPWQSRVIDESMHLTHNLDVHQNGDRDQVYIGGKEGVKVFSYSRSSWRGKWLFKGQPFSEVRVGKAKNEVPMLAAIGPLHGNRVTAYVPRKGGQTLAGAAREARDGAPREGRARAGAAGARAATDQVVAGCVNAD